MTEEFEAVKQRNLWLDALERLVRNKTAMLGLLIALVVMFTAAFAPLITPKNYLKTDIDHIGEGPSGRNLAGTDLIGRDMLSRLIMGARTAMLVAFMVTVISVGLGVVLGAIAAYVGRWVDEAIMRVADVLFSFPTLLLAAFLSVSVRRPIVEWVGQIQQKTDWGFLQQTYFIDYLVLFGALSMVWWPGYARLIRGQILSLRERDFIRAQEALAMPTSNIIIKHLIPNALAPIVVATTLSIGEVMLAEATLSFLGVGIQPPEASWGNMISDGNHNWQVHPWVMAAPGLTLAIAFFGFNYLGDGLNDALNPRQIRR